MQIIGLPGVMSLYECDGQKKSSTFDDKNPKRSPSNLYREQYKIFFTFWNPHRGCPA